MFELALLIALIALVVVALRGGQGTSDDPLVFSQTGYHFTLASQLGGIQGFLHLIVDRLESIARAAVDAPTLFFYVRDAMLSDREYLLAIALRQHTLYIQAINCHPRLTSYQTRYAAIGAFSDAVMIHHPCVIQTNSAALTDKLAESVQDVATETGKHIQRLLADPNRE